jgi:hypothetical protein
MNNEVRRVFLFGVLALLLGGYAYITTPEKKVLGSEQTKKAERAALDFEVDAVTKIDAVFEGKHLTCQRTAGGWVDPTTGAAVRHDAVEDFLANLKKLLNLGEVENGMQQLSEFGLEPPLARIVLDVQGAGSRILALGKNNPVQTSLYAQINEAPQIVLVGSVVTWDLRKLFTAAGVAG